jgi:hypothetical protein
MNDGENGNMNGIFMGYSSDIMGYEWDIYSIS